MARTLAVVPARGGSRGIPRKNLRTLGGRPLLFFSLANASRAQRLDRIVVSSEDQEILLFSKQFGVSTVVRDPKLSEDGVTLDAVVLDAVRACEDEEGKPYDYVLTLQATSPFVRPGTIDAIISGLHVGSADTIVSAVEDVHLRWGFRGHTCAPLYTSRLNRQQLPREYRETGGVVACRRNVLETGSRFGAQVEVYVVDRIEGQDIDDRYDWCVAEALLQARHAVFVVCGNRQVGTGHIHRSLVLANELAGWDIRFVCLESDDLALQMIAERHYPIHAFADYDALNEYLVDVRPDVILNDRLDTDLHYMSIQRQCCAVLVTFEDLGEGSNCADLVFNCLFDGAHPDDKHFYGMQYYCQREEFCLFPRRSFNERVENVLITFGGADPANLTVKCIQALMSESFGCEFRVILGKGYPDPDVAAQLITRAGPHWRLTRDTNEMAHHMWNSDLALTSAGRTVYELASLGVPSIVLAANQREMEHRFAHIENGFVFLGAGLAVTKQHILDAFRFVLRSPCFRKQLYERQIALDLSQGKRRVIEIIKATLREKVGDEIP